MSDLDIAGLELSLRAPLSDALGARSGDFELSLLARKTSVADGITVLLVRDASGSPRAVVLCSAPVAPGMVRRSMERASQAAAVLDESTSSRILRPLAEGTVRGLSYAVLPYCTPLGESRLFWWLQRAALRPVLFEWLHRVTASTASAADPAAVLTRFAEPMRRMTEVLQLRDSIKRAAIAANERLASGAWTPRFVLMHGDLWKGNILVRDAEQTDRRGRWRDRFVVIDWAGSEVHGYAIFDLVRLAQSMHLTAWSLRRELVRHCRALRCELSDARSYLVAALGHIAMNLEHFPVDRYARMAESCLASLERALS